jgi:toxin ParE1/3/4
MALCRLTRLGGGRRRVHDAIEQSCRRLGEHPRLGRGRPEIDTEACSLIVERWLILYRVAAAVQIVRIIDGARDISTIQWMPE